VAAAGFEPATKGLITNFPLVYILEKSESLIIGVT
jgi:hypothetical protein